MREYLYIELYLFSVNSDWWPIFCLLHDSREDFNELSLNDKVDLKPTNNSSIDYQFSDITKNMATTENKNVKKTFI